MLRRPSRKRLLPPHRDYAPSIFEFWLFWGMLLAPVLFLVLAGLFFQKLSCALVLLVILGVVFAFLISNRELSAKLHREKSDRAGESICTFARAFGCRRIDTAIIRAAHEEFQHYLNGNCEKFPLRATDHCEEMFGMDSEELDDLARAIAWRTGRPLENCESNPMYGKVHTLSDVVEFFSLQPLRS